MQWAISSFFYVAPASSAISVGNMGMMAGKLEANGKVPRVAAIMQPLGGSRIQVGPPQDGGGLSANAIAGTVSPYFNGLGGGAGPLDFNQVPDGTGLNYTDWPPDGLIRNAAAMEATVSSGSFRLDSI